MKKGREGRAAEWACVQGQPSYSPGLHRGRRVRPSNDVQGSWTPLDPAAGYPIKLARASLNHRPEEILFPIKVAASCSPGCGMLGCMQAPSPSLGPVAQLQPELLDPAGTGMPQPRES